MTIDEEWEALAVLTKLTGNRWVDYSELSRKFHELYEKEGIGMRDNPTNKNLLPVRYRERRRRYQMFWHMVDKN
jgi:hypothetical protein